MMQNAEYLARVLANERLNDLTVILTLQAPEIAAAAAPGQFVNVSCDRLLRRPFGIMDADPKTGLIKIGVRVQGEGTHWLADRKTGEMLSMLGPLGHGFELAGFQRIITVGGGTGLFPLHFVHKYCQKQGSEGLAVCGYRSKEDSILTQEFADIACQTMFASDAGDLGFAGHAGAALEKLLQELLPMPNTVIVTCGPKIMMKAVADIAARNNIPCQVSLEERMACGIGVCLVCACAIKASHHGQPFSHQRCCVEGPVFPAEVVEWSI